MTIHLEHKTDEEILNMYRTRSRQNMRQYVERYATDKIMLGRLAAAKEEFHKQNYKVRFGAEKSIRKRANGLWQSMISRCKLERQMSVDGSAYAGVTCSENFKNFDFFLAWCQQQTGFMEKDETGYSYELDKDILQNGNRQYNEHLCVFVPKRVNFFFVGRERRVSGLPVGVTLHKSGKYLAQLKSKEIDVHYKEFFDCPEQAATAYKKFRETVARLMAEKWNGRLDSRVIDVLSNYNYQPV